MALFGSAIILYILSHTLINAWLCSSYFLLTFWQIETAWMQGQARSISPPGPGCWNQTCGLAHWNQVVGNQCPPRHHPQRCEGSRRWHSHCGVLWQVSVKRDRRSVCSTETAVTIICICTHLSLGSLPSLVYCQQMSPMRSWTRAFAMVTTVIGCIFSWANCIER